MDTDDDSSWNFRGRFFICASSKKKKTKKKHGLIEYNADDDGSPAVTPISNDLPLMSFVVVVTFPVERARASGGLDTKQKEDDEEEHVQLLKKPLPFV